VIAQRRCFSNTYKPAANQTPSEALRASNEGYIFMIQELEGVLRPLEQAACQGVNSTPRENTSKLQPESPWANVGIEAVRSLLNEGSGLNLGKS